MALTRENALFAGSDGGAKHWAVVASLIETCKLNDVDPHAYLNAVITRIVDGHPNSAIDDLMPWTFKPKADLAAVALEQRLRTSCGMKRHRMPVFTTYRNLLKTWRRSGSR